MATDVIEVDNDIVILTEEETPSVIEVVSEGPQGRVGPIPNHEVEEYKIRFQTSTTGWGSWIYLDNETFGYVLNQTTDMGEINSVQAFSIENTAELVVDFAMKDEAIDFGEL